MVDGDYYKRAGGRASDGTPTFATEADKNTERGVAKILSDHWKCEIHSFGALSPIDWFATSHGRMVSVLEFKSRSHAIDRYPTVFLNVRKWLSLNLAALGLNVTAIYVVKWTDVLGWIKLNDIDATMHRIGGCSRIVKSISDIEPIIEIPISSFQRIIQE